MARSSGFNRHAAGLAIVAAACTAGTAEAAMPGLYFAGFYMDSSLAYSTAHARPPGLDSRVQGIWQGSGFDVLSWDSEISDRKDIGYGFGVGYQFSQYLAAEISYIDMGTVHYAAAGEVADGPNVYNSTTFLSAKTKGPLLAGVVIWPLGDHFSLDAKGGMLLGRTRMRANAYLDSIFIGNASEKVNKNAPMLGAGINWAMSPGMAIRAGYTLLRDGMVGQYDVTSWTLSLKYAW